jgi:ubiquinol-cytochrome c reductase cytochrome b subunit
MATHFRLSIEGVITTLQILLFVGPVIAFYITKRVCLALQRKDREIALHGYETGRVVRLPGGEYIEVHDQLDEYERWKLVAQDEYQPLMVRPDINGRIGLVQLARARVSRWFFEDRVAPVTQKELEGSARR